MDSSRGACEILESKEELNSLHSSEGKTVRKSCVYAVEDDLNQLIKAIDLKISSKPVSPSQQMCADIVRRNTSKKSLKAPEFGISESVTLKQALRRLCISQASEIAAMKRSPKPIGLSGISESGTIDTLYASVVVQTNDPSLSLDEGRGNLVEISFLPQIVNAGSSEKNIKLRQMCNLDSSHKNIAYPSCTVQNSVGAQKTSIKDVIASADVEDDASGATNMGTKGKAISKSSLSSSRTVAESVKSSSSPRLINPIFSDKTFLKKKGKQKFKKPVTMPGSSSICAQHNGVGSVPTPASSSTNQNDEVVMRNKDSNETKAEFTPDKRNDIRGIGGKMSGSARSREKGECSQSSKSSIGDYSSSTSISEESHQSGSGGNWCRPHMSTDVRWIAVRQIILQCGILGLNNFKLLKKLGCGDIGTVYLAELIGSECLFALKVMDIEYLVSRKKILRAQTEREILQMLDHPFLPTLYTHFTTDNLSCLVMEYCPGGDLHVLRQKQPGRSFYELAARFYVAEVLLALEYLHMLGVVYRDLKPENILVREDGHIMLSDFDLSLRCTVNPSLLRSSSIGTQEPSKKLSGPCTENSCIDPLCLQPSWVSVSCFTPRLVPSTVAKARKLKSDTAGQVSPLPQLVVEPVDARSNSFVGTHEYLAPEIIRGDGHGSAVDWWTFGIFLYELLFGRTPFKGPGNDETLANVVSQLLVFPESPTVSFHAKDLIRGLLVKEPENRLGSVRGAAEIKQHPFFEGLNWALIRCAAPPTETPRSYDIGTPVGMRKKKEGRCLDFRTGVEDVEFEIF